MSGVTGPSRGHGWNWQAGGRPQTTGPLRTNTQQININDISLENQGKWFREMVMELEPNKCADFVESFLGKDF